MSRSHKSKRPWNWCTGTDKEPTWTRRYTWRRYRARCRQLMREGRYEMPRFRGTEGWEYW